MGLGARRPGSRRPWVAAAVALALGPAAALPGLAQISPGELSAPHAGLDGSGSCLECHAQRKGVDPALCLDCHELLAARVEAGLGLHARVEYEECATCHIEHHGREFELVWWGDAGESAFDHRLAGYELDGAHGRAGCRDCHRPQSIAAPEELLRRDKELERTFLGLDSACLACHPDEHRGQVAGDSCLDCHTMEAWMPPARFDHDRSRFALTGRHRDLDCVSCHTAIEPADGAGEPYLGFAVAAFQGCADCHRDPHQGRLGGRCSSCHETTGWRRVDRASFDHDRTRFALAGRHREVDCAGCHRFGEPVRVARFARCRDCHAEAHLGQFDGRADGGACESCHEVSGFRPSTFGLEDHQASAYPLAGAHLAVACDACHERLDTRRLVAILGRGERLSAREPATSVRFRLVATACLDCHADPHRDEVSELVASAGCEGCHSLTSWRTVEFDHQRTGYPLLGGHLGRACGDCHPAVPAAAGQARIRLADAPTACGGCHRDPHAGQFAAAAGQVGCERCHEVNDWSAPGFDHQTGSAFPLEGAHATLECGRCHLREVVSGTPTTRYKPLPTRCAGCHGAADSAGIGAGG